MKKILNIISVASNLAIIVGLVTDTYFRVRGARQKTTVTDLENDEVWQNRRVGCPCAGLCIVYTKKYKKDTGDAAKESQQAQVNNHIKTQEELWLRNKKQKRWR